jgi:hypothetical protein
LNPFITAAEEKEYEEYVSHPQNIPLVTSLQDPDPSMGEQSQAHTAYASYINSANTVVSSSRAAPPLLGISTSSTSSVLDSELGLGISEEDLADYAEFLVVRENPLDVLAEDGGKKRYKAYRQWLRGKSLFKQSRVDGEVRLGGA